MGGTAVCASVQALFMSSVRLGVCGRVDRVQTVGLELRACRRYGHCKKMFMQVAVL